MGRLAGCPRISRLAQFLEAKGQALCHLLDLPAIVIVAGFVLISVARWQGGWLYSESRFFLRHYTGDKPFVRKILDVNSTDWGLYQARELSYVGDWLDYNFIRLSIRLGHPHFLSLISYLGAGVIVLLMAAWCVHDLNIPRPLSNLLILLLLAHPNFLLLGPVFRTAKIGAACCAFGLFVLLSRTSREPRPSWSALASALALSLGACLFDRQGFFLVGAAALLSLLFSGQAKSLRWMAAAMLIALAAHELYNRIALPWMMERTVGYRPDLTREALPLRELWAAAPASLAAGGMLFLDDLRYLLGSVPAALCVLVSGALLLRILRGGNTRLALLLISGTALIAAMFSIMAFKNRNPIIYPELRLMYYPLPSTVFILAGLAAGVAELLRQFPRMINRMAVVLGVLLLLELCAWPGYITTLDEGHMKPDIAKSAMQLSRLDAMPDWLP